MKDIGKDFSEVFFNIIKSFNLIIGNKSLIIARKVFSKLKAVYGRITDVLLTDDGLIVVFKQKTSSEQKRRVLIKALIALRNAYLSEVGEVAVKMINFVIKDFAIKYRLPKKLLGEPSQLKQ